MSILSPNDHLTLRRECVCPVEERRTDGRLAACGVPIKFKELHTTNRLRISTFFRGAFKSGSLISASLMISRIDKVICRLQTDSLGDRPSTDRPYKEHSMCDSGAVKYAIYAILKIDDPINAIICSMDSISQVPFANNERLFSI